MSQGCVTKCRAAREGRGLRGQHCHPPALAGMLTSSVSSISCKVLSISRPMVAWGRGRGPITPQGTDLTWGMNKTSPEKIKNNRRNVLAEVQATGRAGRERKGGRTSFLLWLPWTVVFT